VTAGVNKARQQGRVAGFPRLLGGALCLDFINTVEGRLGEQPTDFLATPVDLIRWGVHAGVIDHATAAHVLAEASEQPDIAQAELNRAMALRHSAYVLLSSVCDNDSPPEDATATVERELGTALGRAHLHPSGSAFAWKPSIGVHLLTDLVALDLNTLLTSAAVTRVKQCPGCDDCGWLFLDTSRNGSRQWCSMEGCGSRAKMRRHYKRHRQGSQAPRTAERA
jgi:predicted RNA-binding Zn ribbon-like protein